MRIRSFPLAMAASCTFFALPAAAHAEGPPAQHGSCAAFGGNVANLAQTLGADFGATASGVASSGAGAFPDLVVRPEQLALCAPR